jgi:threonine dehydrogenase-like Zn-dependent dehydrogenase
LIREGEIFGANGHAGNGTFLNVIRLIASSKVDPRPLIGARSPLQQAREAIAQAARTRDVAKAIIEMT